MSLSEVEAGDAAVGTDRALRVLGVTNLTASHTHNTSRDRTGVDVEEIKTGKRCRYSYSMFLQ